LGNELGTLKGIWQWQVSTNSSCFQEDAMFATRGVLTSAVGLLMFVMVVQAQQRQAESLPHTFTGTWAWSAGDKLERVTLAITQVEEQDGIITFSGSQTYHDFDLKEKVKGRIDRRAGKITFMVSEPSKAAVIDGKFEGTISANLETVTCVWVPTNGGTQGDLKLTSRKP